ncbi:MAG: hypothetical protein JEZ14_04520 [Marinilabiliaceae bacterium]|nr:hypothetical protein [Marinilabiliaceae bacterium]
MSDIIQISDSVDTLSREQVDFNKKILLIEKRKKEINTLKERIEAGRRIAMEHIAPLEQKHMALTKEYIRLLDQNYDLRFFKKKEKEKIAFLIREELSPFISNGALDDELSTIEEKYFSSESKEEAAELLSELFGFDLNGEDLSDLSKVREKMDAAQAEREQAAWQQRANKSQKKVDKEDVSKTELVNVSKTVKQIYTDLVKLLHPDREQDEEKVAQKTEWMKDITRAYQENNFFALLHFHQQFMADKHHHLMDQMDDSQLKYYIKLLSDQLKSLNREKKLLKDQPMAQAACELVKGSKRAQQNRLQRQIEDWELEIEEQQVKNQEATDKERLRLYIRHINVEFLMQQQLEEFPFPLF